MDIHKQMVKFLRDTANIVEKDANYRVGVVVFSKNGPFIYVPHEYENIAISELEKGMIVQCFTHEGNPNHVRIKH